MTIVHNKLPLVPESKNLSKCKYVLNLISLSPTVILLQGKYYLTRTIGDAQGYFTLNWISISDQWYIISDHTSASKE